MKTLNVSFSCEQDKIDFVLKCEKEFNERLSSASKKAISSGFSDVLLSGPTCSGKTTAANKIIDDIRLDGRETTVISFDDFFKDRADKRKIDATKKIDYDSIDIIDFELLRRCVKNAKPGKKLSVPVFDFLSQSRTGYAEHTIVENEIIVFEGIQAVYPEVYSLFNGEYIGIFINVDEDVMLNGIYFSRDEIRLIRRIVRDRKFRGASADFTLFLWQTVRENEDKNIFPNKNVCEIQIDSFMGYELFVMKKYILEVLGEIDKSSPYFSYAEELKEKFETIDEISYDYVPENSLYTEFLGKKK